MSNPTVMVCKYLAALIEQQRQAGRVTNEQATAFVGEIAKVIDTYHASRAQLLAPMSASMGAFTYFFVVVWMYTVCVVIAWNEDTDAATLGGTASMGGVGLPMGLSFGLSCSSSGCTRRAPSSSSRSRRRSTSCRSRPPASS